MGFRPKNKNYRPLSFPSEMMVEEFVEDTDKGYSVRKLVSASPEMPDLRSTDLELQLKAGVPLQQVNTKMIPSRSIDAVDFIESVQGPKKRAAKKSEESPKKEEPKQEKTSEVKNEN